MKLYYVYILKCSDNTYYVGFTSNLEQRIMQHNIGTDAYSYTFRRRPVTLMWMQEFTNPTSAIAFEKKIKKWSKAKKEALIAHQFDLLPSLSECKNDSHCKNEVLDSARTNIPTSLDLTNTI